MNVKILKEYCDLSDRPAPTIFEFVPSKDQPLVFRDNNLLVPKQDHFDKISYKVVIFGPTWILALTFSMESEGSTWVVVPVKVLMKICIPPQSPRNRWGVDCFLMRQWWQYPSISSCLPEKISLCLSSGMPSLSWKWRYLNRIAWNVSSVQEDLSRYFDVLDES